MTKQIAVAILAHVDAGKTTLSESMLYLSGEIRKAGRVDHGDAFLDTDQMEKERGITIFSKQAIMHLPETTFTLLDTPGHVDFSSEMERTLQVPDYAILVISGIDEVLSENGYDLILKHTNNSRHGEITCLTELLEKDIDGIIIEPSKSNLYFVLHLVR